MFVAKGPCWEYDDEAVCHMNCSEVELYRSKFGARGSEAVVVAIASKAAACVTMPTPPDLDFPRFFELPLSLESPDFFDFLCLSPLLSFFFLSEPLLEPRDTFRDPTGVVPAAPFFGWLLLRLEALLEDLPDVRELFELLELRELLDGDFL